MELTKNESENIVLQLQQAHRISVSFYRRILPTLDYIAEQLGCVFSSWDPIITDRICRSKTQPSKAWAWDFVPLYASSHTYLRVNSENITCTDDFGIIFELHIEDSFSEVVLSDNEQPDAISMPTGKGMLIAMIYRPKMEIPESFYDLWEEEEIDPPSIGSWSSICESWNGIKFEWTLSDVIQNSQVITQVLKDGLANNTIR